MDWSKIRRAAVARRVNRLVGLARGELRAGRYDGPRRYGASPTGPVMKVPDAVTRELVARALLERQREAEWRAMWGRPLEETNPDFSA